MKVLVKHVEDHFHFEGIAEDKASIHIDGAYKGEGGEKGPSPMQLLLMGLGGCSGMDIIGILKKQKLTWETFDIEIEGEREKIESGATPYKKIHAKYIFKGDLPDDKVERAIKLSMEKYCSVTKMLEKMAEITYSFEINK